MASKLRELTQHYMACSNHKTLSEIEILNTTQDRFFSAGV